MPHKTTRIEKKGLVANALNWRNRKEMIQWKAGMCEMYCCNKCYLGSVYDTLGCVVAIQFTSSYWKC